MSDRPQSTWNKKCQKHNVVLKKTDYLVFSYFFHFFFFRYFVVFLFYFFSIFVTYFMIYYIQNRRNRQFNTSITQTYIQLFYVCMQFEISSAGVRFYERNFSLLESIYDCFLLYGLINLNSTQHTFPKHFERWKKLLIFSTV